MLVIEFKDKVENLLNSKNLEFKFCRAGGGAQRYSIELKTGLFEVFIFSDGEVGINLPSEDDSISFGGCDEAYNDLNIALDRIRAVIAS